MPLNPSELAKKHGIQVPEKPLPHEAIRGLTSDYLHIQGIVVLEPRHYVLPFRLKAKDLHYDKAAIDALREAPSATITEPFAAVVTARSIYEHEESEESYIDMDTRFMPPFEVAELDWALTGLTLKANVVAANTPKWRNLCLKHLARSSIVATQRVHIVLNLEAGTLANGLREKARQRQATKKGRDRPVDAILADYAGVSRATLQMARYVFDHGSQDIREAMFRGKIAISRAYKETRG